jgi:hypothetical protein
MVHYAKSVFYPIIGLSHEKIVRYAAKTVRQPVLLINDAVGSFPENEFPANTKVALLDDNEHILTIELSGPTAQFSQDHHALAVECALNGWLEVKR